ncbi:MAG: ABC transporter ATP-binding protein [Desulfobacterales bacterium]|uniref:ABC transporter ATP-binding protein n=1 Tax=Candidatus Desulfatibia vada TaxID=2841696 RepID=A0A8J6TMZ1_9BACT|nr:ABC transporter ATP-binding protein [Candidatus Desulfatibia vada]MBL6970761.1 ABC transporter ATP-binding protein [Desulfobacterales bacterium]
MNTAIDINHISCSYGNLPILKNLSFSVQKGDFFIVIGPNGSGKTTLMKVISGILKPQKGNLEILGRPLRGYTRKALAKTVAFVPQMVSADFPFTVIEVILMGRSPHLGILGLEQEIDLEIAKQAIAFTGVEHLANRKMDQLSGGELQRVFLARAICQEPQIMLLDEPTASLDLAHQGKIMDLMEKLKKEKGVTIVMVSHDVNLAAMYADRLLLLKDGKIVSCGLPGEVLTYQTLEEAYGCKLLVDESPLGKSPRITLVPQKFM